MKVNELFEAKSTKLTDSQRRYQQNKAIAKMKAKAAKRKEQRANPLTDEDKRKLYDVLSAHGPDVDMYSPKFGRLAGEAKRAGILDDKNKIFKWLEDKGLFGPKSDKLRGPGDKYYPESVQLSEEREPQVHKVPHTPHESDAYDHTQTSDEIRDGDVLHLGGDKTGVMVQAWPVEVTGNHSKESGFHTLGNGKTWDTLDDGKYKRSAEIAHAVAKKHGSTKKEDITESVGDRMKQAALKLKRETDIQGYLKKMIEYCEYMSDAMDHNMREAGKLSIKGQSFERQMKKFDKDAAKYREELRGFGE